jgi:hypothetical protein
VNHFLFFFPLQFLQTITTEMNRYGNKDWVPLVSHTTVQDDNNNSMNADGETDDDDQPESKRILKACLESHAKARHCFKGASNK